MAELGEFHALRMTQLIPVAGLFLVVAATAVVADWRRRRVRHGERGGS